MKKVALINPGKDTEVRYAFQEPLNLGFIASFLEKNGIEVKIFDELSGDNIFEKLESYKPDIAGLTATTIFAPDAYRIAQMCKKMGIKTVMGGVHATAMPEEALQYVDVLVKGESEIAMLDIVNGNNNDRMVTRPYIKNLDEIPMPAYHLMNMPFYLATKDRIVYNLSLSFVPPNTKVSSIITTRGCPHACTYCNNRWRGIPYRSNSPAHVLENMKYLIDNYKVEAVFFADENFFAIKSRVKNVCELILKNKIDLAWSCNSRVDTVDLETFQIAKESGCKQVSFGFESGSQKILDILNKKTTIAQGKEAIRLCKKARIMCGGSFMLGNPTETVEDLMLTKKFILENDIDNATLCITTPYPGTELWEYCKKKNLIPESLKWADLTGAKVPITVCENISPKEIEKYRAKFYLEISLRKKLPDIIKTAILHPFRIIKKALQTFRPILTNK